MLMWHERWEWFSFLQISSILSGSYDRLQSLTGQWILILRTRHSTWHNTKRLFGTIWRMNAVTNIDLGQSIQSNLNQSAVSSPLQQHQSPIDHSLIIMICPAMMRNTECVTLWLRRHPHEAILEAAYWVLSATIWVCHLTHHTIGDKSIHISMIASATQWILELLLGYRT